ncbi:hypothetical protein DPM19_25555 [Actinomadura craniellae]|uniref:Uncharacterized protein n=1 Tax=Actinomadura craniellae TaxID=2231787 RepID=A0A365H0A5_9ACTN|nr:hypothetical protein [Actinomadura craniellae]RAY12501.1 hypothetical protein DPM19_25555 [Actinomadura craniellae]
MTLVLVVMCIVVGVMELYAGRQSKQQAAAFVRRIEELNDQVSKQNGVLTTVGERLTAELARVKSEVLPGIDSRLRATTGQIDELTTLLRQNDTYIKAQANRLHDLENQRVTLAALRRKLAELETSVRSGPPVADENPATGGRVEAALSRITDLERNGDRILELQRALTRTLEDVEDVVSDLLEFTTGELDESMSVSRNGLAPAMLSGRLWNRDPRLHDVLTDVYERCVKAHRLTVRFRTSDEERGRLRYFLTGRNSEELGGGIAALLISIGMDVTHGGPREVPADEAALQALLRAVHESSGATVQLGPLVVARTREELVCAVLTLAQSRELEDDELLWDPAGAVARLRLLPGHQVWDLTAWAAAPPAAPSS